MKVVPFINNNPFELVANGYVLFDEKNNCVVIDPGKADNQIVDFIKGNRCFLCGLPRRKHLFCCYDVMSSLRFPLVL